MKFFVLFLCFLFPSVSMCCICSVNSDLLYNYDISTQVFKAKVVGVSYDLVEGEKGLHPEPNFLWDYELEVIKTYKGRQHKKIIYTRQQSSCGFGLKLDKEYIFFNHRHDYFVDFSASYCSVKFMSENKSFHCVETFLNALTDHNSIIDSSLGRYQIQGKKSNGLRKGKWIIYLLQNDQRVKLFTFKYKHGELVQMKYNSPEEPWLKELYLPMYRYYHHQLSD